MELKPEIKNETQAPTNEFIIEDEHNYKYKISLELKENKAIISLINSGIYNIYKYQCIITLELLKQKSDKFVLIKNLENFRNFFYEKLKNKEIKLISKDNIKILELTFEIFCEKEIINFQLEKINIEKEDLLEKICNELNQLREKYEKIEEENIKLKNDIEEMKIKYEKVNNELIFKEQYPIFDNIKQYDFIIKILGERLNRKISHLQKIYQATVDGDTTAKFHSKVDGHSNTLIIIKSTNDKIFGAFTSLAYHSLNGQYYYDSNAFIFSLTNLEIYEVNKKEHSVWIGSSHSVLFGSGHDIWLQDKCLSNSQNYSVQTCYNYKGKSNALTGGSYFTTKDYIVYQVLFE